MNCRPVNRVMAALLLVLTVLGLTAFAGSSPDEARQRGRQHLVNQEYDEAVIAFTEAIQPNSDNILAYIGRATAYRGKKDHLHALEDSTKVLNKSPGHLAMLVTRGIAYHGLKDDKKALADLNRALEIDENCIEAYLARAAVYWAQKDLARAAADYSRAVELDPACVAAHVGQAEILRQQGEAYAAIGGYSKAIEQDQKRAPLYFRRAQCAFAIREYDQTINDCNRVLELDPAFVAAYSLRGVARFHRNEYGQAESDLNETLLRAAKDTEALLWRGRARMEMGKLEAAIEDLTAASQDEAIRAMALRQRAKAYDKAGLTENRIADDEAALELEKKARPFGEPGDTTPLALDLRLPAYPKEALQQSLEDAAKPPVPVDQLIEEVREACKAEQELADQTRRMATVCEMETMAPDEWNAAEDAYRRATAIFEKGEYEVAATAFRIAREKYAEVLDTFDTRASSNPALWLDWAWRRAEAVTDRERKALVWRTIAEAAHRWNDRQKYTEAMGRSAAHCKSAAFTDPALGVIVLPRLADRQIACGDADGARASLREAAVCCEALTNAASKANNYATIAGMLHHLGSSNDWNKYMSLAARAANQVGDPLSDDRARHPLFVNCLAYAQARDFDAAFSATQTLDDRFRRSNRPSKARWLAEAYANTACAAAREKRDGRDLEDAFDRAYVAACTHLASVLDPQDGSSQSARRALHTADVALGAVDRAWVGALQIPSPQGRAAAMAGPLRLLVEAGRFGRAVELHRFVPSEMQGPEATIWLAAANFLQGRPPHQLRVWAEDLPSPTDRALALIGLAHAAKLRESFSVAVPAGLVSSVTATAPATAIESSADNASTDPASTGTTDKQPETPTDSLPCSVFDADAAKKPDWWLDQAIVLTRQEPQPRTRASLWLCLAQTQKELGNDSATETALLEAKDSVIDMLNVITAANPEAQKDYHGVYRWDTVTRPGKDIPTLSDVLQFLLDLEEAQTLLGRADDSYATLLMMLKIAEFMPRSASLGTGVSQVSLDGWLARIAGRAQLRGRTQMASTILSARPWFKDVLFGADNPFLAGLTAAEARDQTQLAELADRIRGLVSQGNQDNEPRYAATLYSQLALVCAEKGDTEGFRRAVMTTSGLFSRGSIPGSDMLTLARAAAMAGQTDVATDLLEKSRVFGAERDRTAAAVAVAIAHKHDVVEARKIAEQIADDPAKATAWFAVTGAEASAPSANLSALFDHIKAQQTGAEKAASLAAVAAALSTE